MHKILEKEDFVQVPDYEKLSMSYKLAWLIKQSILEHKWNAGTEGRDLTWEQARDEWMEHYHKDFVGFFNANRPKHRKTKLGTTSSATISVPFHMSF